MLFTTDQQTLNDLNIFGKHGSDSIYEIYNGTKTRGGALLLREMFSHPLSDDQAINRRSRIIQYFAGIGSDFPIQSNHFDAIEPYLENIDERTKLSAQDQSITMKLSGMIAVNADTAAIKKGLTSLIDLLKSLNTFITALKVQTGHPYQIDRDAIAGLLAAPSFSIFLKNESAKLSHSEMADYDLLLRFRHRDDVLKLMRHIYLLDVYFAVAKVATTRGFVFPEALSRNTNELRLKGVYHPQVKNAMPNNIEINSEQNVVFLTGANMAGKSTFMKSLSIALFLAHMGFPVAASKMEFSVLDGLYTTINLPDNLGMGESHFYAEVLRAKKMAMELKTKKLFVLFDELFRGTNVKDAREATIAFTEAFARKKDSIFVLSTHIIEAGEVLKERCENINFIYLPTLMDGNRPVYTYTLEPGITEDRHGMLIINNENILGILDQGLSAMPNPGEDQTQSIKTENKRFMSDKQTLDDLNLLGKYKPNSIFSLFNHTRTTGAEKILEYMFHNPFTDAVEINERSAMFRYFHENEYHFPFKKETFKQMESYLELGTNNNFLAAMASTAYLKFSATFLHDEEYNRSYGGLIATVEVLNSFRGFLQSINPRDDGPYADQRTALLKIFSDPRLKWLSTAKKNSVFSLPEFAKYDYLLKHTLQAEMKQLLKGMHMTEVYLAVSQVARIHNFHYAQAQPAEDHRMRTTELRHPGLSKGVPNPICFDKDQNLMFLTGANMAGKSTFMKACGIALYLSHMGFPVAARDMTFSVLDGIYSSINVADDLTVGHSHFYAEVLRVKQVAEEVASGKNLLVLFDELFKGTNVKDAYDGTLSITAAFSKYRNCFYVFSTHIIEVGEELRRDSGLSIRFAYLPTIMNAEKPSYTYQLKEGITSDRQGMMIIQNEGILEMI